MKIEFLSMNRSGLLRFEEEEKLPQTATLSVLTSLVTLPRCQVLFQWKQTKEKLGNALGA